MNSNKIRGKVHATFIHGNTTACGRVLNTAIAITRRSSEVTCKTCEKRINSGDKQIDLYTGTN